MSATIIQTILTVLIVIDSFAYLAFGCKIDGVTQAIDCSTSWVGPQFAGVIAGALGFLKLVIKWFEPGGLSGKKA